MMDYRFDLGYSAWELYEGMASVVISKWVPGDYQTTKDSPGAIKLLSLYCNIGQQDAKNIIDKIKNGHSCTVDVKFIRCKEFKELMLKQGYNCL